MSESLLDSILRDVDEAAEQESLRRAWDRLDSLEPAEPSPELARRFARTIEFSRVAAPQPSSFRRRLLPLAAVLIAGVAIGSLTVRLPFASRGDGARAATSQVELDRLSHTVSLVFESRPLGSRRLEAVEMLAGLAADPEISRILTTVVNTDPSVDVRLGAIDAIGPGVADEDVARRLIQAVPKTDSTLVRIRLIELFVDHRIDAALPEIESLHRGPNVDELVREAAQWATHQLRNI